MIILVANEKELIDSINEKRVRVPKINPSDYSSSIDSDYIFDPDDELDNNKASLYILTLFFKDHNYINVFLNFVNVK